MKKIEVTIIIKGLQSSKFCKPIDKSTDYEVSIIREIDEYYKACLKLRITEFGVIISNKSGIAANFTIKTNDGFDKYFKTFHDFIEKIRQK